ncbi:hypothetical protein, partial [Aerococcus mictus]|uniref:hypothetical protein n=1 Tax=Aerococcus mictus TaxID=2976810 RepID=UPI000DCF4F43
MTIRPIIFSGPMVRALLDGRKTQTRRIEPLAKIGVIPDAIWWSETHNEFRWKAGEITGGGHPKYRTGDLLWVRENFAYVGGGDPGILLFAATWQDDARRAGCDEPLPVEAPRWTPSIHMTRTISRLTLEVTGVKVERLQGISEEDARAEGAYECENGWSFGGHPLAGSTARGAFYCL